MLVTSTMPPIPVDADAPPDLATPFTASAVSGTNGNYKLRGNIFNLLVDNWTITGPTINLDDVGIFEGMNKNLSSPSRDFFRENCTFGQSFLRVLPR